MTEFISRKYGNDGYEVIIKTDSQEHYKASENFARRLIDHEKPMTNADRIRSMTDEELAKILDRYVHCGGCPINKNCVCDMPCEDALLYWLKEPAEVE
jgi:hypothetical protein